MVILVLSVLLPIVAIAVGSTVYLWSTARDATDRELVSQAQALSGTIARELEVLRTTLLALGTSPTLAAGDFAGFYKQLETVPKPKGSRISLTEADGSTRLSSNRAFGMAIPNRGDNEIVARVFATGQSHVSDLYIGHVSHEPVLAIDVPVRIDGVVRYDLGFTFSPSLLTDALIEATLPNGRFATLRDGKGVIAARSQDIDRYIGRRASQASLDAFESGAAPVKLVSMQGVALLVATARVPGTNWSVAVAVRQDLIQGVLLRSLAVMGLLSSAVLALGLMFAAHHAQQIARPLGALAAAAEALGQASTNIASPAFARPGDRMFTGVPRGVREVSLVGVSLERASTALRDGGRLREAAQAALRESDARLARMLTTTPAGVIELDTERRITFANAAAERIFGATPGGLLGLRPSDPGWHMTDANGVPIPQERLPGAKALAGDPVSNHEHVMTALDGRRVVILMNMVPVWGQAAGDGPLDGTAARSVIGMIAAFQDVTSRHQQARALRASEQRMRLLLDSMNEGFFAVDRDGVTTLCNAAFLQQLGFAREEDAIGRQLHDLIHHSHPDGSHYDAADCPIYITARSGRPAHVTGERFFLIDGTSLPVEYWVQPIRGADGSEGAVCTFVDVTERERTAAALRASEERLQLTLANAQIIGLWDIDLVRDVVHADERFAAMYGVAPDRAAAGLHRSEFGPAVHPADRPRLNGLIEEAIRSGGPYVAEYRIMRPGGVRHVLGRGRCSYAADGSPANLRGIVIDITEQRQAEERLRLAQRAGGIGTFELDEATRTVLSSEEFCHLWGLPVRGAYPLEALLDMVLPDDRPRVATSLLNLPPDALTYVEYRIARADTGAIRWIARRGEPLPDADAAAAPGARRYVGVVYDVTDRKRLERELLDLNDALEQRVEERTAKLMEAEAMLRQSQKMEAVGQLTGGIAHDFNNMLQAIGGSLELLQRRVEQGRTQDAIRFADSARRTVDRAAALTHRLLAFARRQALQPRGVEPNALVLGMDELIRRTVGSAVDVVLRLDPAASPVLCDPNQLENVLLNLAINARDAMPEGGVLTITTGNAGFADAAASGSFDLRPGDYVEISVTDTGTGMDAATQARAFEPFFTTKPLGQGTGLGLSQLYGFVRQSDGAVRLDSAPGRGTTVRLLLPRHAAGPPEEADCAPSAAAAPEDVGRAVLLVEDETEVRTIAAEHLRERGFRVIEAADGPSALELIEGGAAIDGLVTDVGLPGGLNGRQLADAIRARRPGLPVLFITGYAGGALEQGLEPGMDVIGKPFGLEALEARIRLMLQPGFMAGRMPAEAECQAVSAPMV